MRYTVLLIRYTATQQLMMCLQALLPDLFWHFIPLMLSTVLMWIQYCVLHWAYYSFCLQLRLKQHLIFYSYRWFCVTVFSSPTCNEYTKVSCPLFHHTRHSSNYILFEWILGSLLATPVKMPSVIRVQSMKCNTSLQLQLFPWGRLFEVNCFALRNDLAGIG